MYSEHSEGQAYWHRDDQSGQDAEQVHADWISERERIKRDMNKRDLVDALYDSGDLLLAVKCVDEPEVLAKLLHDAVNRWLDEQADISIFGKPMRGRK